MSPPIDRDPSTPAPRQRDALSRDPGLPSTGPHLPWAPLFAPDSPLSRWVVLALILGGLLADFVLIHASFKGGLGS